MSGNDFTLEQLQRNRNWNAGYHDGYNNKPFDLAKSSDAYKLGYEVGKQDRIEDEEQLNANGYDDLYDPYEEEEKAKLYDLHDRI